MRFLFDKNLYFDKNAETSQSSLIFLTVNKIPEKKSQLQFLKKKKKLEFSQEPHHVQTLIILSSWILGFQNFSKIALLEGYFA